ncbi:MAG TPA: GAF domain-containing protein [Chthonomonadaceae bacterium]|nr:GAF domain-containing protein [Chthonomonadaceae bacterium]
MSHSEEQNETRTRLRERLAGEAAHLPAQILESLPDGVLAIDAHWRCTYANPAIGRILPGCKHGRDLLLGRDIWKTFPSMVETGFYSACRQAMAERTRITITEYCASCSAWLDASIHPYEDGLFIYLRDITPRKRAEEALQEQAAEIQLLYEAGRLLGSTLDPNQIYDGLRRLIARQMDCDSLLVSSFDAQTQLIRCAYAYVEGEYVDVSAFPPVPLAPMGRGMQSEVIHTGEPLLVPDLDERQKKMTVVYHIDSKGTVRDKPQEDKPRSLSALLVPIKLEGQVLGIVQVMSSRLDAYTDYHLRILEGLVLQMAAASRNAFLYQQTQAELRERERVEAELRKSQEAEHRFQTQLATLLAVGNELSLAPSFDELCRRAVELGRSRLGFDRLGIWFRTAEPGFAQGAFGTDESGNLRDERGQRIAVGDKSPMGTILANKIPSLSVTDGPLRNHRAEVVGQGWHILAALWDGEEVIGCIDADNLLENRPLTEEQQKLLTLFASTVGHLCSRKRAEEALAQHQTEIEGLNRHLRRAMTETHHRVKNNLQLIAAMIDMRLMDDDQVTQEDLRRLAACINTLASVHEVLTQEAATDGEALFLSSRAVLERLLPLLKQAAAGRSLQFQVKDTRLSAKQGTSLALIANELISNAFKYSTGTVQVTFHVQDGTAELEVCDDGPGFPEGFDPHKTASTGMDMIESLSRLDLGGKVRFENRPEGGACATLSFPLST